MNATNEVQHPGTRVCHNPTSSETESQLYETNPNTPPETNIAPENRPLEKEIPIGNHYFQGLC